MSTKSDKRVKTDNQKKSVDTAENFISFDNNKQKNFFSKKNLWFILISFIACIIFITLEIIFVLKIDFKQLFNIFFKDDDVNNGLWLLPLFIFFIFKIYFSYAIHCWRLKSYSIKLSFWDKMEYGFCMAFLVAISPANFITDPFSIWWLKKKGINLTRATSIVIGTSLIWQLVCIIVTFPSFIYVCENYHLLSVSTNGVSCFWLNFLGVLLNICSLTFYILIGVNKHIHLWVSMLFNKIKKIFKRKYLSKHQVIHKYLNQEVMLLYFKENIRNWKVTNGIFFICLIFEFYVYLLFCFSYAVIKTPDIKFINWYGLFNCANCGITANKYIPLPGGELSIEFILKTLTNKLNVIVLNNKENTSFLNLFINNGLLLWRFFFMYLPFFVGAFGFIAFIIKNIIKSKKNLIDQQNLVEEANQ